MGLLSDDEEEFNLEEEDEDDIEDMDMMIEKDIDNWI